MNKQHRVIEKMILRQMDADESLPIVPVNRHQRRAAAKVKK